MEKTYHFMAGLPRSGSTLLSSLLNQHPEIYASPQTDLLSIMYQTVESLPYQESYNAGVRISGYENVVRKMSDNFYEDVDKRIVIDKNRAWGTPYNFSNIMPMLNENPKVVVTMRPILEVLASFTTLCNNSPGNFIDKDMEQSNFWPQYYRNFNDARCDFLMRPQGEIDQAVYSIWNLKNQKSDNVLFIWYEDLTKNTQNVLNQIYSFLSLNPITNNLEKIISLDIHDDISGYGIKDLHLVGETIQKNKTEYEKVLSPYVIDKYKNFLDFLQ
jgi:sulfotransferase